LQRYSYQVFSLPIGSHSLAYLSGCVGECRSRRRCGEWIYGKGREYLSSELSIPSTAECEGSAESVVLRRVATCSEASVQPARDRNLGVSRSLLAFHPLLPTRNPLFQTGRGRGSEATARSMGHVIPPTNYSTGGTTQATSTMHAFLVKELNVGAARAVCPRHLFLLSLLQGRDEVPLLANADPRGREGAPRVRVSPDEAERML